MQTVQLSRALRFLGFCPRCIPHSSAVTRTPIATSRVWADARKLFSQILPLKRSVPPFALALRTRMQTVQLSRALRFLGFCPRCIPHSSAVTRTPIATSRVRADARKLFSQILPLKRSVPPFALALRTRMQTVQSHQGFRDTFTYLVLSTLGLAILYLLFDRSLVVQMIVVELHDLVVVVDRNRCMNLLQTRETRSERHRPYFTSLWIFETHSHRGIYFVPHTYLHALRPRLMVDFFNSKLIKRLAFSHECARAGCTEGQ
jgi:hypothetical protein